MLFVLFSLFMFIHGSVGLFCETSFPAKCLYNSTCRYQRKECEPNDLSTVRGGMYCSTLVRLVNEEIIIENMACMYDQETTKSCKNQSQCLMKSTSKEQIYLHCCCDQHLCNLNFQISNHSEIDSPIVQSNRSNRRCITGLCLSGTSLIVLIIAFLGCLVVVVACFLGRRCLFRSGEKVCRMLAKRPRAEKSETNEEKESILEKGLTDAMIAIEDVQLGCLLKRGRFASIHQGFVNQLPCAIKIFSQSSNNNESKKLFVNEKEIYSSALMQHPNILKYYGYAMDVSSCYILSELSVYGSLRSVLYSRLLKDEKELQFLCREISSGLEYLHRDLRHNQSTHSRPPIAHRDFKSDNILYLNDHRVVLCDFAMSIHLDQNQNFPNEQQQIGTPRYMSPELLSGTIGYETNALLKCDVYALGIVFWEILSRYRPPTNCSKEENVVYELPFERQLRTQHLNVTPTIGEMLQIIHLNSPLNRPLVECWWKEETCTRLICSTMEECWDQNPEGRINAALVALRMQKLI